MSLWAWIGIGAVLALVALAVIACSASCVVAGAADAWMDALKQGDI